MTCRARLAWATTTTCPSAPRCSPTTAATAKPPARRPATTSASSTTSDRRRALCPFAQNVRKATFGWPFSCPFTLSRWLAWRPCQRLLASAGAGVDAAGETAGASVLPPLATGGATTLGLKAFIAPSYRHDPSRHDRPERCRIPSAHPCHPVGRRIPAGRLVGRRHHRHRHPPQRRFAGAVVSRWQQDRAEHPTAAAGIVDGGPGRGLSLPLGR